ncbi:MAG: hypothetical protein RLZZ90_295 [Actinomycetota bacterium]
MKLKPFLALVLVLVLVTAGCAQLPRSGAIKSGPNLESGLTTDYLYYSPVGPLEGDTQLDVLNGFLNAGTGPQNDYATARDYLSEAFKSNWNPSEEVLIQRGKPVVAIYPNDLAEVSIETMAKVNADGQYMALEGGASRLLDFKFVKENGQWRISEAPNLTVIIKPVFDVIFRSYSLYFFDNQFRYLVPDLRWFPSRASTGTRLVNALLKGPSDWLEGAVQSALPKGTKLATDSVTVVNGVASVDLTNRALTASPIARQHFKVQLRQTLSQLSNVSRVNISIERTPQEIADLTNVLPSQISFSPVALIDDNLVQLTSTTSTTIIGAKRLIQDSAATDFALSADENWLALNSESGTSIARLGAVGTKSLVIDSRTNQLHPLFDRQGFVWTTGSGAGQEVAVTSLTGEKIAFNSGWMMGFQKLRFSLSSEGSRAAVLVQSPFGTQVFVSAVLRDKLGVPTGFGSPYLVLDATSGAKSVSWLGEVSLGVLVDGVTDSPTPTIVTVGGGTRTLPVVDGAVDLIGTNTVSSIYLRTLSADLYQYRGVAWIWLQTGAKAVHFAGF